MEHRTMKRVRRNVALRVIRPTSINRSACRAPMTDSTTYLRLHRSLYHALRRPYNAREVNSAPRHGQRVKKRQRLAIRLAIALSLDYNMDTALEGALLQLNNPAFSTIKGSSQRVYSRVPGVNTALSPARNLIGETFIETQSCFR